LENNKKHLTSEGNALKAQKHQLSNGDDKLLEIDKILSGINKEQDSNNDIVDNLISEMETRLLEDSVVVPNDIFNKNLADIENQLNSSNNQNVSLVSEVEHIALSDNSSWDEYLRSLEDYSFNHNLDTQEDPFKTLMTKSQQVELQKRINEDFTIKNANCDKYDYMIAGTCGVIGGLIDILFVGVPGGSKLGDMTDELANKTTEKFAGLLGWNKEKALEKGSNTTASAIGFLENKYKINYDQAKTVDTGGIIKNLSTKNHHLKSLGHSPDLIGLFFSILNQFTSTSTFISSGKIITIDTDTLELQGDNFIAKIFCGIANWFGHIMSDWTGASGTVGQGNRGTGVPIPFYNLFQLMNFGRFGDKDRKTFAIITSEVFEKGYDLRHGLAMAIPVVITELLIRFMYTMKSHFYHNKSWLESIPKGSIPELRRMLLVGHGTLCIIDGADAAFRSGGELVQFLLRTNLIAWARTGQLALKELSVWYHSGHIDADAVDEYLDMEYKKMLTNRCT
jgi:hypothetical protein